MRRRDDAKTSSVPEPHDVSPCFAALDQKSPRDERPQPLPLSCAPQSRMAGKRARMTRDRARVSFRIAIWANSEAARRRKPKLAAPGGGVFLFPSRNQQPGQQAAGLDRHADAFGDDGMGLARDVAGEENTIGMTPPDAGPDRTNRQWHCHPARRPSGRPLRLGWWREYAPARPPPPCRHDAAAPRPAHRAGYSRRATGVRHRSAPCRHSRPERPAEASGPAATHRPENAP